MQCEARGRFEIFDAIIYNHFMQFDWRGQLAIVVLFLLVPAFVATTSQYYSYLGVDDFSHHLPLSDKFATRQTLTSCCDSLVSVDALIVQYKAEGDSPGEVRLKIVDQNETTLREASVPIVNLADDQFVNFVFEELSGLKGEVIHLDFDLVGNNNSVAALRYGPDNTALVGDNLSRRNSDLEGTAALQLNRSTNIYGMLGDQLAQREKLKQEVATSLILGLLVALILVWVESGKAKKIMLVVVVMAVIVTGLRLSIVDEARGVSGGDPYNYFLIKQNIQQEFAFYKGGQKRLPVYPISLMPGGLVTNDIQLNARVVNQLVVGATLVALALVIWQLGLPPGVAWLAVIFTAVNRDFIMIGFRPLAYPMGGLLMLLATSALLWARRDPKKIAVASVLLGLAAQTRHETLAAAGVLVLLMLVILIIEKRYRSVVALLVPVALISVPYFIANMINYGNPFYVDYLDHPVTNPRRSLAELSDHIGLTWGVLGSSWWYNWAHEYRIELDGPIKLILTGGLLTLLIPLIKRNWSRSKSWIVSLGTVAALLGYLWWLMGLLTQGTSLVTYVSMTIFLISVVGLGSLVVWGWREGIVKKVRDIAQSKLSQMAIVFSVPLVLLIVGYWIHPVSKQFYSLYPYLGLLVGWGVYQLMNAVFGDLSWRRLPAFIVLLAILMMPTVKAVNGLVHAMDFESRKNSHDWLTYNLARHMSDKNIEGKIAAQDWLLPYRYYLEDWDRILYESGVDEPSPEELTNEGVKWVLTSSYDDQFQTYWNNPDIYPVAHEVKIFDRKDERVYGRLIQVGK